MKRKIAVVTGTRAEYGILEPLLRRITDSEDLELKLIVTGMHLLKKYGMTMKEIEKSGLTISNVVEMYDEKLENDAGYSGRGLANGIKGTTETLKELKPNIVVVFGDRMEPLAATLAAATLAIPIAHIHGGDKTDSGHIDESIRHAITRFAHIHFTATRQHTRRLVRMGEEPWRIFQVGALGLDSIIGRKTLPRKALEERLRVELENDIIICVFNPVIVEEKTIGLQMHNILDAIKDLGIQTLIIYPNNDAGSQDIIGEIKKYQHLPFIRVFPNLAHNEYVSLLKQAKVLIGNSSSGIIEAPSVKLPVVNVGSRNRGREHTNNVIFVDPKKQAIENAVRLALHNEDFKSRIKRFANPYGDGRASERIVEVLGSVEIDKRLLQKKITY